MLRIILMIILLPISAFAAPDAPANLGYAPYGDSDWTLDATLPSTIYDDNYEGWKVDPFLGNFAIKSEWHDGRRLEVGGMHRPLGCEQGDGKIYCSFVPTGMDARGVVEVDETTGVARLLMHWTGAWVGDIGEVRGGDMLYNSFNSTLYIVGSNCIRKVEGSEGSRTVSLLAGQCGVETEADGTGASAGFESTIYGWAAAQDGNMYFVEVDTFRKVTTGGVVTTLDLTRPGETGPLWNFVDYHFDLLSVGEDSNTLYLADNYGSALGFGILKVDISAETLTRVAGVSNANDTYGRQNNVTDGPALTMAGFKGGARGMYSPFYSRYFLCGNDELRLRALTSDETWVKTVALEPRYGTTSGSYTLTIAQTTDGLSTETAYLQRLFTSAIPYWGGVDDRGGMYYHHSKDANMVFRMYNPPEGGTQ